MRNIVRDNEGLNIMLNEIVNHELDKTITEMVSVVEDWKKHTDTVSCETVICMLKANLNK